MSALRFRCSLSLVCARRWSHQKQRLFRFSCGSCPVRQGEAFRSVQARRAAVTSGGPAPAPPIPHMVGVLRSASAWGNSPMRSGLARAAAAHISGAPPQGRVTLALTASCGRPDQAEAGRLGAKDHHHGGNHERGGLADPLLRASSPLALE